MPELSLLLVEFIRVLVFVTMLVGLLGMVVPIFPGGFVIWLAALVYGLVEGFTPAGYVFFALITLLMIAGSLVDNVLMASASRQHGASWLSLALAFVGGVLGTIFFPPFGGLLGAPLFLFVAEWRRQRNRGRAWLITRSMLVGWGWSFVARFVIGLVMIAFWLGWVLWVDGVFS